MTFTDTAQSSVQERNFSKIWSVDILGGEKLHFSAPPFINRALHCNRKKLYLKLYFLPIKKITVSKIEIHLKKKHNFTQSVQKFPLNPWAITN